MRLRAFILAIAVVTPLRAFAQAPAAPPPEAAPPPPPPPVVVAPPEATPPPPPPAAAVAAPMAPAPAAPAATPWYQALTLEALVDSYYMLNLGHLDSGADSLTPPALRQFDLQSNSFTLNYAKVGMGLSLDPIAFRIDLGYGHTGAIINFASGSESSADPTMPGSTVLQLYGGGFIVQQAFASLTLGKIFTIDMGKFVTTAGAEVIESNKNWLYSRSFLFFSIPLLHTGARFNLKLNDMIALQASLVNGVNNDPDNNANKMVGASLALTPLSTTSIIATTYFGKRGPQGAEGDTVVYLDLVAAHSLNDNFGLNLNVDYVRSSADNWIVGGSLMGRFALHEHVALAARGEILKNKGASTFATGDTMFYEGTLGAAFPFAKRFETRVEFRGDFSGEPQFNGEDNQFTGTVAFLGYLQ
jgi:hypothetical protein